MKDGRRIAGIALGVLLAISLAAHAQEKGPQGAPGTEAARSFASKGELAFAAGSLKDAESLYEQSLEIVPGNPHVLVSLAAVKTRLGKIEESRGVLLQALSLDLSNGPAWLLLGMNSLEQKRDDEALADLMQAVCHDGRNPRAHNYLGIAAGRKGWNDMSEQELRRAVELNPDYADANFNLAVFYLGRTPPLVELAHRHYQRALDLGAPRDPAVEGCLAKAVASPSSSPASF